MSLRELQTDFARIVTDDSFRRLVSEGTVSGAGQLHALAVDAGVAVHAAALKRKRLGAAASRLRITSAVLADEFAPLFMRFAGVRPLQGRQRYDRDALAFLDWLDGHFYTEGLRAIAASDRFRASAKFERAELMGRLRGRFLRIAMIDGRGFPDGMVFSRSRFLVVWLRLSVKRGLRRFAVQMPF